MALEHVRNLVFEGGGMKMVAALGAMERLDELGVLHNIRRVGGASAGAITAALFALGFTVAEQREILESIDFNDFFDDGPLGFLGGIVRLLRDYGWYKGSVFQKWVAERVGEKLGRRNATFSDLFRETGRGLYVVGTNLNTRFSEVFSHETTPTMTIVEALRISMSLPFIFAAPRKGGAVYTDGGFSNNYPIQLFDREGYIDPSERAVMACETEYYARENSRYQSLGLEGLAANAFVYNRQTLGIRLDSGQEIAAFWDQAPPTQRNRTNGLPQYLRALVETLLNVQEDVHLRSEDWQRTIYVNTLGIQTLDTDISDEKKRELLESGHRGVDRYLAWFCDPRENPANRPWCTKPSEQAV